MSSVRYSLLCCFVWLQFFNGPVISWVQDDEFKQPRQIINASQLGLTFVGNRTEPDHFKLLERDGDYLLVGARDMVYNISIRDFAVHKPIVWPSTDNDVRECQMKGKSADDCHNYIRVLAKDNDHGVLVCGTNAFKPKCRMYGVDKDGSYVSTSEFPGNAISPYDPAHNSTAVYVADRKEIFSGTVADFVGSDPLIYKHTLAKPNELGVRTERSDAKCLNDPDFVSSFADKNHVYFWFRESAVEYMNCGKAVYSRVARVCKNDLGGPRGDKVWSSFSKARLNCSLPGDYPYYFDEIGATSGMVAGRYGSSQTPLVYAVFNTPYNTIRATAICAFSMEDISETFTQGSFKAQSSTSANWLPIPRSQVPSPRPGTCDNGDSRQISDEAAAFMKRNPLMEDAIPNYFNEPLLVQSATKSRFTQIAVHPQVAAVDGQRYDVLFLGTDAGKIMKMVNVGYGRQVSTVIVESVQVFANRAGIKNMLVYNTDDALNDDNRVDGGQQPQQQQQSANKRKGGSLVVVSDNELRSLPLHYCERATSCLGCVRLQDPYCAWDLRTATCVGVTNGAWINGDFIQNVKTGQDQNRRCPPEEYERGFQIDDAVVAGGSASRRTIVPPIDDPGISNTPENPLASNNLGDISSFFADDACNCSGGVATAHEKQALRSGGGDRRHSGGRMPSVPPSVTAEQIHESASSIANMITQSQMAVAVVSTLFVSLAVGFICGIVFSNRDRLRSKMRNQKVDSEKFTTAKKGIGHHHHLHTTTMPNGGASGNGMVNGSGGHKVNPPIHAFEATPKFSSNDEGGDVEIALGECDKSVDENSLNNYNSFTLPKDYKVKKVYL